jgi:predicted RNA-binding protein with PIN domain
VIVRRVQRSRNPGGLLVVTSDQELARTVVQHGARVRSADAFATELGALNDGMPDRTEAHLSPDEVDSWLALFEGRGTHKHKN